MCFDFQCKLNIENRFSRQIVIVCLILGVGGKGLNLL